MKKIFFLLVFIAIAACTIAAEVEDTVQYKTYDAIIVRKTPYFILGQDKPHFTYTIRSIRPNGIMYDKLVYPIISNVREEELYRIRKRK